MPILFFTFFILFFMPLCAHSGPVNSHQDIINEYERKLTDFFNDQLVNSDCGDHDISAFSPTKRAYFCSEFIFRFYKGFFSMFYHGPKSDLFKGNENLYGQHARFMSYLRMQSGASVQGGGEVAIDDPFFNDFETNLDGKIFLENLKKSGNALEQLKDQYEHSVRILIYSGLASSDFYWKVNASGNVDLHLKNDIFNFSTKQKMNNVQKRFADHEFLRDYVDFLSQVLVNRDVENISFEDAYDAVIFWSVWKDMLVQAQKANMSLEENRLSDQQIQKAREGLKKYMLPPKIFSFKRLMSLDVFLQAHMLMGHHLNPYAHAGLSTGQSAYDDHFMGNWKKKGHIWAHILGSYWQDKGENDSSSFGLRGYGATIGLDFKLNESISLGLLGLWHQYYGDQVSKGDLLWHSSYQGAGIYSKYYHSFFVFDVLLQYRRGKINYHHDLIVPAHRGDSFFESIVFSNNIYSHSSSTPSVSVSRKLGHHKLTSKDDLIERLKTFIPGDSIHVGYRLGRYDVDHYDVLSDIYLFLPINDVFYIAPFFGAHYSYIYSYEYQEKFSKEKWQSLALNVGSSFQSYLYGFLGLRFYMDFADGHQDFSLDVQAGESYLFYSSFSAPSFAFGEKSELVPWQIEQEVFSPSHIFNFIGGRLMYQNEIFRFSLGYSMIKDSDNWSYSAQVQGGFSF